MVAPRQHDYEPRVKTCLCCGKEYSKKPTNNVRQWGKSTACSRSCSTKLHKPIAVEKRKENFWLKLDKSVGNGPRGDCWEWRGCTNINGYGITGFNGRNYMAHRLALELKSGNNGEGLFCLHSCDNPPCCNPSHLRWGTHQENMNDMTERKRTAAPKGINHYAATLKDEDVREIKKDDRPCSIVATDYNVSCAVVNGIRSGKKWRHII